MQRHHETSSGNNLRHVSAAVTRQIFKRNKGYEQQRNVLGSQNIGKVESAALDQIWTGFDEYSDEFYMVSL